MQSEFPEATTRYERNRTDVDFSCVVTASCQTATPDCLHILRETVKALISI